MLYTIPQRVPVYARNVDTVGDIERKLYPGGLETGLWGSAAATYRITLAQGRIRESSR